MRNSLGDFVTVTLFGESHGEAIGAILDGLPAGITVNENFISECLSLRRPADANSTSRIEADNFKIVSGVYTGKTTGTPICLLIPNSKFHSSDYSQIDGIARPGHADYTAFCKYHGYEDRRGGGHFSGRITAALVAVGAIAISALEEKGIKIGTHISRLAGIDDRSFNDIENDVSYLSSLKFPVLNDITAEKMKSAIQAAKSKGDSVGGTLETFVIGLPAGVGEPWFDSIEGKLSNAMFSIPGIKGVSFGDGFEICDMNGSAANDPFYYDGEKIVTLKNSNGGINGGITNGMPIIFKCAVKPTPSISIKQNTVDFINNRNCDIEIKGRHDPCIVHRAASVVKAITALVFCDILTGKFGSDYLLSK